MVRPIKYLASASVFTALGAVAPLWVWFHGDLLGAAIIAIPSALMLAHRLRHHMGFSGRVSRASGGLGIGWVAA
jgi:hypothetical protein